MSLSVTTLAKAPSPWLNSQAPEAEVVLSSRIRLARNLSEASFPAHADAKNQRRLFKDITAACKNTKTLSGADSWEVSTMENLARRLLMERRLISYDQVKGPGVTGVVVAPGELLSVMVNEEDHLRLQSLEPGLALSKAWKRLDILDDELSCLLEFAYDPEWGYLTACPTNAGTGLRASCLVHLPALIATDQINLALQNLSKLGVVTRGFYGEGTRVVGDIFQVSNAATLGKTETDILENIERVVRGLIQWETDARKLLSSGEHALRTEDKIFRAYGILSQARAIAFEESMQLLSQLRLGLALGLLLPVTPEAVLKLMIQTQPAHLQIFSQKNKEAAEAPDVARAQLIRRKLASKPRADRQKKMNNPEI